MYYFYINFPRYSEKNILIHVGTCGHCNHGNGKRGTGSNEKGFWAGPFKKYEHAVSAFEKLQSKLIHPPIIKDCKCI